MSFKREGDDPGQLQVLKKRRVAELLANYIPEDEALLLRNGRYACTVCFQRPVFDTLDMLTVHRSGKKHLASLQKFYGKKHSLENEVQKRQHQAYLQAEEDSAQGALGPAPLLAQTRKITWNALLKTVPYSSCCRPKREARGEAGASSSGASASFRAAGGAGLPKSSSSALVGEEQQVGEEASSVCPEAETQGRAPRKKFARQGKGRTARKPSGPDDPERRRALEHYLQLKRVDPRRVRQVGQR
ncbi:sodium channel modifier 1 isoform X2 [Candoia aspera]|uniref:sodium channel modifier 1 isoform X2 n=1 Tax=Candoia aspera TaxID=51853 RepID=UPI002FD86A1C